MAGKYEKKKSKGMSVLLPVLLVVFAAIIAVSVIKITANRQEAKEGVETYTALADSVLKVEKQEEAVPQPEQAQPEEQEEETIPAVPQTALQVDFDALRAINPQSVAWISSDNGVINYPVVQGTDNEYYLNHMVDGTVNRSGAIFMDFRSDPELRDRNTFIYGHNMLDGAMFASLSNYSKAGYLQAHPALTLITPGGSCSLQVFAGCVVPGNSDVYQLTFADDEAFAAYLDKIRLLSEFSSSVEVTPADRIVTLSTCAYDYDDARYVLFCKLVPMQ